ncbi:MAG: putative lipoprotein, partial [Myxococcaceae bacterium]|nr:putative lipoprotein [Myxococcaceae bacterium]
MKRSEAMSTKTTRSPKKLIAKEERRLGVTFQRALLVALAGIGCSTKAADAVTPPDPDASVAEAGVSSEAGVPVEAGKEAGVPDKCDPTPYTPMPADTCGDYLKYPCGLPADLTVRGDCYFALNDCAALCSDIHYSCRAADGYCSTTLDGGRDAAAAADGGDAGDFDAAVPTGVVVPDSTGAVLVDCATCPGSAGRVPAGLEPSTVRARSALGAYFASAARLEAASVTAFRRLREELALHGAPTELLEAARAAERDEVRHTRAMARLARRHGGRYERPRVAEVAPRSLETIAQENAVEGCARETFGALLATWQAEHVDDAALATTLAEIAVDETRHAALSWAIARWSLTQLDAECGARMSAAWSKALDDVAAGG